MKSLADKRLANHQEWEGQKAAFRFKSLNNDPIEAVREETDLLIVNTRNQSC